MADLFGEVDSDMRAEQARLIVKRYGFAVAGLVLIVAIGVGAWQILAWQREQRDAKLSSAYFVAMQNADRRGAADEAAARAHAIVLFHPLAQADNPGIRALSRLRLAQLEADRGDQTAAIADLDAVANDPQASRPLRDLATLASVQRQMTTANPATLSLRLQGLEQPGRAFSAMALEASAMIDLAAGKIDQTRHTLQLLLVDENATDSIRERANTLLQAIGPSPAGG